MVEPVHFTSQLKALQGNEGEIIFNALIDEGRHVYSTNLGDGGSISATFNIVKMDGAETVGKLQTRGKETKQFDKLFDMELRFFEHKASFVQKVRFTKPTYTIDCYLEYGACNDEMCMPPTQVEFKQQGKSPATDPEKSKIEVDKKTEDEAKVEEATVHDTIGAKWSYLQSHKFGANAQPYYVILDPVTARPLSGSRAYDEDIPAYLQFLDSGLERYREIKK